MSQPNKSGYDLSGVVLLTSSDKTAHVCGTGIVVGSLEGRRRILTCGHVVETLVAPRGIEVPEVHVCANGQRAEVLKSGADAGIDLAEIAADIGEVTPVEFRILPPKEGTSVLGLRYAYLAGDDYAREHLAAKVVRPVAFQRRGTGQVVNGWIVKPDTGFAIEQGNSGTPLFDLENNFVGILSHQRGDCGLVIAASEVLTFLGHTPDEPADELADGTTEETSKEDRPPKPQFSKESIEKNDRNKGAFGGKSHHRGRQLTAKYSVRNSRYFYGDFTVESTDGSEIQGPVYFYLHETYPKPTIRITRMNSDKKRATLEDVYGVGAYTVGASVKSAKGDWVPLELDLAKDRRLPKALRER